MTPTIRKILLPTDFGPSSERAAAYAAALARGLGASVHLVHVMESPSVGPRAWPKRHSVPARDQMYQEGRARLAALAAKRLPLATNRITLEVRTGAPAEAIVDAAIDYGADLIIMSAPARTAVPNVMMGCVAQRVLQAAPCPVLAVSQSGAARVLAGGEVA